MGLYIKFINIGLFEQHFLIVHREERKILVIELNIRKKALQDVNFPSQDVIDEFCRSSEKHVLAPWKWSQPNLIKFMVSFIKKKLASLSFY